MDLKKIRDFLKECENYGSGAIIEVATIEGQIRFDSDDFFMIDRGVLISRDEGHIEYINCDDIVRLTLEVVG